MVGLSSIRGSECDPDIVVDTYKYKSKADSDICE